MADERQDAANRAGDFLAHDFEQCFEHMRYYDGQLWDICKFIFSAYTILIGVAVGLYQYSLEKTLDLTLAAMAAMGVALILGLFALFLTVRTRVYFVVVTRYINEHRGFFLSLKPLGFANKTRMYTNRTQPPYFDWCSSHFVLSFIIAFLNSILATGIVWLGTAWQGVCYLLCLTAVLAVQVFLAWLYLHTRENKSASQAVFGRD